MSDCNVCEYWKRMMNKTPGVRVPGGFGKCTRPGGHCNPDIPRGGIGGAKSTYKQGKVLQMDRGNGETKDMVITPLNNEEQHRLEELEAVIDRNMQGVFEWGCALMEIKGKELYRGTHDTFEVYLRERWDIARNYANKLISASSVIENIGTNVPVVPVNEAQARPLAKLKPHEQRDVWIQAVKTAPGGKITARFVENLVKKKLGKKIRKDVDETRNEMWKEVSDVRFKNTFNDFMQAIIEAARFEWKDVSKTAVRKHIQALLEAVK